VARWERGENYTWFCLESPKEESHVEDYGVNGGGDRIKMDLGNIGWRERSGFTWLRLAPVRWLLWMR
jgi:hypothetical protein